MVRSLPVDQFQIICRETVQQHMSNKLHIFTLLATMASRMEHLQKRSVQTSSSSFITRAIVAVRERLNDIRVVTEDELWDLWYL
jgi:predicted ATPase